MLPQGHIIQDSNGSNQSYTDCTKIHPVPLQIESGHLEPLQWGLDQVKSLMLEKPPLYKETS